MGQTISLWGKDFHLDETDSLELAKYGVYEPDESALISSVLTPDSVCLDIGAHIGYYSCLLAQCAGKVYAFEPYKPHFDLLAQNLEPYDTPYVLFNAAVGAHPSDRALLYLSQVNAGDHRLAPDPDGARETIVVETVSIDSVIQEPIDFCKIDVQGYEGHVLRGMEQTLARSPRMAMAIEFFPVALNATGTDPDEVLRILHDNHFKIARINEGQHTLTWDNPTSVVSVEQGGYCNLWCIKE